MKITCPLQQGWPRALPALLIFTTEFFGQLILELKGGISQVKPSGSPTGHIDIIETRTIG